MQVFRCNASVYLVFHLLSSSPLSTYKSYAFFLYQTAAVRCPIFFPLAPKQAFLTHNGQLLGSAFPDIRSSLDTAGLYPCVGLHSPGEAVRLNFGQRPFLFDLSASVAEEDSREQAAVAAVHVCPSLLRSLVRDYLLHQVLKGDDEGGVGDNEKFSY